MDFGGDETRIYTPIDPLSVIGGSRSKAALLEVSQIWLSTSIERVRCGNNGRKARLRRLEQWRSIQPEIDQFDAVIS